MPMLVGPPCELHQWAPPAVVVGAEGLACGQTLARPKLGAFDGVAEGGAR